MPVTLAEGNRLELKAFCQQGAQVSVNVLHYQVMAIAGGGLTDTQVVASLSTTMAPIYKALMSSAASYLGARLQRIQPIPVPVAVSSTNGAGVGTAGANATPPQSAALVTKLSNLAGRRNRGRVYLPFIGDSLLVAAGVLSADGVTAATNWSNVMFASINVAVGGASVTLAPIIFNRKDGSAVFMTSVRIRTGLATQRRRAAINRGDQPAP